MTDPVVECYSGHTYAQEPRAFTWQGYRFEVTKIDERWRTPQGPSFAVQTKTKDRFELDYDELQDLWTIHPLPLNGRKSAKCAEVIDFPLRRDRQGSPD